MYFIDRLHVYLYKEKPDWTIKKHGAEKAAISLEGFYGIESGFVFDKEQHVMAIICQHDMVLLAFSHRETLIEWEIKIREELGEGQSLHCNIFQFHKIIFSILSSM